MIKSSIYGLTLEQLRDWLPEHGQKKSRASRIWEWLYQERVHDFAGMSDVRQECLDVLAEHFTMNSLQEHVKQESSDGTVKFLLRLQDGNLIETVLMRQKYGLTVCVTTQVGCNIGCSFCASGLIKKAVISPLARSWSRSCMSSDIWMRLGKVSALRTLW